ncbi:hypothetical protein DFJ58DRAFT_631053, partial [Suillus subalutaceus]|uniref:uncharacterized protein n=1 Tax=Suillus subalutaceus TaxID=48586 RepID=UPI001B87A536
LRHSVGFRPVKEGSPRAEVERISLPLRQSADLAPYVIENAEEEQQEIPVIHAHGMGATGYQRSLGVVIEEPSLLKENV